MDGVVTTSPALVIEDGVITQVGTTDDIRPAPGQPHVHFADRALVPGTVNAHNHSFQSLLRGFGDDLPFLQWRDKALYRYSPELGPDGLHTGALFAFGEMLLHGVTTVCDFFYINDHGNDNAQAIIDAATRLGIRIVLARCFYDWDGAPSAYRETTAEAVRHFTDLARKYPADAPDRMVTVQPAPHSLHGASRLMIEAGHGCATDAGVPMHIHLAEEQYQVDDALEHYRKRPLHAVESMGVLGENTVAVHGCWFDASERALLAERGASLAYNPNSNMFLGDGVTDIVDLVSRGVKVGLGTDGGCSNSRVSVFDEMRACALLQKVHRLDGQAISAEDCYSMGTHVGAQVLGLPVGRIAPGFRADLVALDLGDPSLWPVQSLAKNIVYSLSSRAVTDVMVQGRHVVKQRELQSVPLQEIRHRVRELTRHFSRD